MEDLTEYAEMLLAEMTGERKKMARLVLAVTGAAAIAALALLLDGMVSGQLARDAAEFRQAIDDQGRKAAKARHPAGRDRGGSGGNRTAARTADESPSKVPRPEQ